MRTTASSFTSLWVFKNIDKRQITEGSIFTIHSRTVPEVPLLMACSEGRAARKGICAGMSSILAGPSPPLADDFAAPSPADLGTANDLELAALANPPPLADDLDFPVPPSAGLAGEGGLAGERGLAGGGGLAGEGDLAGGGGLAALFGLAATPLAAVAAAGASSSSAPLAAAEAASASVWPFRCLFEGGVSASWSPLTPTMGAHCGGESMRK